MDLSTRRAVSIYTLFCLQSDCTYVMEAFSRFFSCSVVARWNQSVSVAPWRQRGWMMKWSGFVLFPPFCWFSVIGETWSGVSAFCHPMKIDNKASEKLPAAVNLMSTWAELKFQILPWRLLQIMMDSWAGNINVYLFPLKQYKTKLLKHQKHKYFLLKYP